jgi:hypothetical protein
MFVVLENAQRLQLFVDLTSSGGGGGVIESFHHYASSHQYS